MKKIIITEGQKKMLEDYQQIDDNRTEKFTFYSLISPENIDFNNHNNSWEATSKTKLFMDWNMVVVTNNSGYEITTKINYLIGVIVIGDYDTKETKTFNIDKSWRIIQQDTFGSDTTVNSESIYIHVDFNNKIIKI